jgi:uncharacterized membrane protein
VLIGRAGFLVRGVYAVLSLLIVLGHLTLGVLDLLVVLGGLVAYLIDFGLNRGRSILHVLFGRASGGEHDSCYDACGRKKNSHGFKTSL